MDLNKKLPDFFREFWAPRVGLEPTTLRLQFIQRFHAGLDYLIIPLLLGVGRF